MCDCQILFKISVFWLSEAKNEAKEVFCEARGVWGGDGAPPHHHSSWILIKMESCERTKMAQDPRKWSVLGRSACSVASLE